MSFDMALHRTGAALWSTLGFVVFQGQGRQSGSRRAVPRRCGTTACESECGAITFLPMTIFSDRLAVPGVSH